MFLFKSKLFLAYALASFLLYSADLVSAQQHVGSNIQNGYSPDSGRALKQASKVRINKPIHFFLDICMNEWGVHLLSLQLRCKPFIVFRKALIDNVRLANPYSNKSLASIKKMALEIARKVPKKSKAPKKLKAPKKTKAPKSPEYTEAECFAAMEANGFQVSDLNNFSDFFDENSVLTLAEAGEYKGPAAITEYVAFLSPLSPFIADTTGSIQEDTAFRGYDKKHGYCSFRQFSMFSAAMEKTTTDSDVEFIAAVMMRIELDPETGVIDLISVFFDQAFIEFFFVNTLDSDVTRQSVCSVMASPTCGQIEENCVQKLSNLPISNGGYVDGNSQGCRILHSVLATFDAKHCAHIAFEPTLDSDGAIKCQNSKELKALFDESDFEAFGEFEESVDITPGVGYYVVTNPFFGGSHV